MKRVSISNYFDTNMSWPFSYIKVFSDKVIASGLNLGRLKKTLVQVKEEALSSLTSITAYMYIYIYNNKGDIANFRKQRKICLFISFQNRVWWAI